MRRWWLVLAILIGGCMPQALNNDYALPVQSQATGGWTESDEDWTWSYVSADSPTFVLSVNADVTELISAGMRLRGTQTTVKYGIVTAVGSYSGGATQVTIYGGTDYTWTSDDILSVAFSNAKAPFGFPLSPAKWTVEMIDANDRTSTTFGSVVHLHSSHIIDLPIGIWNVEYQAYVGWTGVTGNMNVSLALSTSDSSFTNVEYQRGIQTIGTGDITPLALNIEINPVLISVSSKTRYYLVGSFTTIGATNWSLVGGSYAPTQIRAVSAYL